MVRWEKVKLVQTELFIWFIKLNSMKDSEIENACNLIKEFHFALAGVNFFKTTDKQVMDTTFRIVGDTTNGSPIDVLIKSNNWKELFENQRWLLFLEGAQNFSVLDQRLVPPLKLLAELFPEETKMHIIPEILRE